VQQGRACPTEEIPRGAWRGVIKGGTHGGGGAQPDRLEKPTEHNVTAPDGGAGRTTRA